MSDERVSDGLIAELQRKIDDGTPRGLVWPFMADMLVVLAPTASTPQEIEAANEALVAMIHNADDRAVAELEMQECVAQLRAYLDPKEQETK